MVDPEPWTSATCKAVLRSGANDDACTGTFECQSDQVDCCRWLATCDGVTLHVEQRCGLCECKVDSDCAVPMFCNNGFCRDCVETPVCVSPFFHVTRNGCAYCVPQTKCREDRDCLAGLHCYAGQTCPPGCVDDPACCHGNGCAAPGCGTTIGIDCALVGCPDGYYCDVQDIGQKCSCDQNRWSCTPPGSPSVCRPL